MNIFYPQDLGLVHYKYKFLNSEQVTLFHD